MEERPATLLDVEKIVEKVNKCGKVIHGNKDETEDSVSREIKGTTSMEKDTMVIVSRNTSGEQEIHAYAIVQDTERHRCEFAKWFVSVEVGGERERGAFDDETSDQMDH